MRALLKLSSNPWCTDNEGRALLQIAGAHVEVRDMLASFLAPALSVECSADSQHSAVSSEFPSMSISSPNPESTTPASSKRYSSPSLFQASNARTSFLDPKAIEKDESGHIARLAPVQTAKTSSKQRKSFYEPGGTCSLISIGVDPSCHSSATSRAVICSPSGPKDICSSFTEGRSDKSKVKPESQLLQSNSQASHQARQARAASKVVASNKETPHTFANQASIAATPLVSSKPLVFVPSVGSPILPSAKSFVFVPSTDSQASQSARSTIEVHQKQSSQHHLSASAGLAHHRHANEQSSKDHSVIFTGSEESKLKQCSASNGLAAPLASLNSLGTRSAAAKGKGLFAKPLGQNSLRV
jgi:hypothetical protein